MSRRRASRALTKLGNYVILAGQVGVAGHLKIGNRVSVAAQSGVMHNIPDGEKWLWTPAQPDRQAKRQMIALQQLPELIRRVAELERQVAAQNPPPPLATPITPMDATASTILPVSPS